MLDVRGVHKRLGGRQIIEDVTFACQPSELVMVLGCNGAGKSTLLRVLAGVLEPDRGEVLVDGASMARGGVQARKSLGYAPDASGATDATDPFPHLMVSEFVGLTRILKGLPPRLDDAPLRSQLEVDAIWNQRLGTLSFGQRKRVYILSAALGDPKVLILDEPSNGLDQGGTQVLATLLASRSAQGLTTICATNDLTFVQALPATRLRIADGRVAAEPD